MSDLKDRLRIEIEDLKGKVERLQTFVHSDDFPKIPMRQQELLIIQASAMTTYCICLMQRISYLQ